MLLPKFEYHEPTTLEEALHLLSELGGNAKVLAGGTDLLVRMKLNIDKPTHVISIARIPGLDAIVPRDKHGVTVGAGVSAAALSRHELMMDRFTPLALAAGRLGAPMIRNRATIGGNLVNGRPAADLSPACMVLNAKVKLKSATAEKEVSVNEFFRGPGDTAIEPNELMVSINVETPAPWSGGSYIKLGARKTLEISMVNVAALLTLKSADGPIADARIAFGAVAPTPVRAYGAEEFLVGKEPSDEVFQQAGEIGVGLCSPITDHRGTMEYRCMMIEVLTKRALKQALERAKSWKP
ncbi:MAG: xanthine dehydrogenase family protein subunit M [Desulfomonile tiedjei]|uniref:Xanthine dehydrogenase family protein subunit M n=1 Tax=Desulfomonile tiedjei TaxID=2358 RepID=A0A9D6V4Z8_9BACT|nr:xanthine dehydrogenase family protein subunit M [Desulfomonile tiedjei]